MLVDRSLILTRHIGTTNQRAGLVDSAWAETKHLVYTPSLSLSLSYRLSFSIQPSDGALPIELASNGLYLPYLTTTLEMADCTTIDNTVQLHAGECRGGFDFTLLFEESILILLPIALAILIAALRFTSLLRSPVTTGSLWLGVTKTVSPLHPSRRVEHSLTEYTGLLDMRCCLLLRCCWSLGNTRLDEH